MILKATADEINVEEKSRIIKWRKSIKLDKVTKNWVNLLNYHMMLYKLKHQYVRINQEYKCHNKSFYLCASSTQCCTNPKSQHTSKQTASFTHAVAS